jgi:hypothetical protein
MVTVCNSSGHVDDFAHRNDSVVEMTSVRGAGRRDVGSVVVWSTCKQTPADAAEVAEGEMPRPDSLAAKPQPQTVETAAEGHFEGHSAGWTRGVDNTAQLKLRLNQTISPSNHPPFQWCR